MDCGDRLNYAIKVTFDHVKRNLLWCERLSLALRRVTFGWQNAVLLSAKL